MLDLKSQLTKCLRTSVEGEIKVTGNLIFTLIFNLDFNLLGNMQINYGE